MAMMQETQKNNCYYVVHPLDDAPEEKRNPDTLGLMAMSPSVKYSLFALRAYLIVMGVLVFYRVLGLAGFFAHGLH